MADRLSNAVDFSFSSSKGKMFTIFSRLKINLLSQHLKNQCFKKVHLILSNVFQISFIIISGQN